MALSDPLADMLTIIRNASRAKKDIVEVKNSRLTESVIKILKAEEFITNYKLIKDNKQGIIRIYLRYHKNGNPALLGLKRISRPGLRAYRKADALPKVYGGLGVAIVSTSKGVMTDTAARDAKTGGEVLCFVW